MANPIILAGILLLYLMIASTRATVSDGFKDCLKYFYKNEIPQLYSKMETDTYLCQKFGKDDEDFHFATFYDKPKKIPHYSAYMLPNDFHSQKKKRKWRMSKDINEADQASLDDYKNIDNDKLTRGHLAPRSFVEMQRATDVLTNIAPQYKEFNMKTWGNIEVALLSASKTHCSKLQGILVFFQVQSRL
ncbi:Hypothetical predicted protein [Mytilus galloprovincialis]|uniref:ENPP1-3/EXOG-like endonuclease/phosphodiesterase domain-containing protein n=1 Tax=Mytilus galloprovincialis TaxID=29158 RepID=A0A8B6HKN6_MYTGA|nr:Hypothetical predicted protein [Mytilus galloprovincialis]